MVNRTNTFFGGSGELSQGQEVIVYARWVLVAAAMGFALWLPAPLAQLRVQAFLILLLAIGNFFLHAQVLRRRPAPDWVVYGASAADLVAITALLWIQGGYSSELYIFYFPAVLAISVAFSTEHAAVYTISAISAYAVIGALTAPVDADVLTVVVRCLMIAAVAVCGNQYQRIEGARLARQSAAGPVLAQLEEEINR